MGAVETKSATAPAVILLLGLIMLFTPLLPLGALLCLFGGVLLLVRLIGATASGAAGGNDD